MVPLDDARKAQRSLAKADEEDGRCASSVGDIRLACASLDRELQSVAKEKEELILAESLKKLEVLRNTMPKTAAPDSAASG